MVTPCNSCQRETALCQVSQLIEGGARFVRSLAEELIDKTAATMDPVLLGSTGEIVATPDGSGEALADSLGGIARLTSLALRAADEAEQLLVDTDALDCGDQAAIRCPKGEALTTKHKKIMDMYDQAFEDRRGHD